MWKAAPLPLTDLRLRTEAAEEATRSTFLRTRDGAATIQRRTTAVDALVREIWSSLTAALPAGTDLPIALFALGGYGRRELFPSSDIDVLFLCATESTERDAHELIRTATQAIWDIGLRASPATRTLKECERLDGETNLEFALSLLDRRFLAGDPTLAARFEGELLINALLREAAGIEAHLAEAARGRHAKYGDTIFHLEPNIKECPGGLRDFHLIHWLQLLRSLAANRAWPSPPATQGMQGDGSTLAFTAPEPTDLESAFDFLAAARCFLHIRNGRDDNTLDWVAQDEAAAQSIGLESLGSVDPAYWMRTYYRHARTISRRAALLLDEAPSTGRKPLLRALRRKRNLIPGTPFWVEDNRITLEHGVSTDAEALLRVFAHIAQFGSLFREDT